MSVLLPEAFLRKMQLALGDDYERFVASYRHSRAYGLRINTAKLDTRSDEFDRLRSLFALEQVPWCPTGYYYEESTRPGRHPYHAAGVYYIQEPSAMSAVELLDPQPGEIVLDLAAAPGGKSTQIADKLQGEGLLVSNEIHPARATILSENIERMGVSNAIVTNASPGRLAERFSAAFDRIMVDAPCSGEGMFRKEPEAVNEWSEEQVAVCAARQMDILHDAVTMLKPGGTLGYSTCTFSEEENEQVIAQLTERYPQLAVSRMERFWPHETRGEGHYVAILKHTGEQGSAESDERSDTPKPRRTRSAGRQAPAKEIDTAMRLYAEFADTALTSFTLPAGEPVMYGEQLYWLPTGNGVMHSGMLHGIKSPRPGLHLGAVRKNRFEPSHALALALKPDQAAQVRHISADSREAASYLRGETLPSDLKGWTLAAIDGYPVGWGKSSGGILKNHYPKGLRRPN